MNFFKKSVPFVVGLGIGTLAGFALRNSESTDYNAGYQPDMEIFDEKDYFTDEVVENHLKEKAERKKAQKSEEYEPKHAKKETKKVGRSKKVDILKVSEAAKKGKGYKGKTRTSEKHSEE